MVEFVELKNGAYEFIGIVRDVKLEISPEFKIWRYHMILESVNKNWKNQHNWIPIGKQLTEHKVAKGTALAEFIQQLISLGIEDESKSTTEIMNSTIGKKFWFTKKRIGKMEQKNSVWFPERLENDVYGQERQ